MMNILKFLLSPLLNEHGYTTLATASIGVGKPVTTGIFTNIKTALDSFNDGTGIGDGVISNRTTYRRTIKEDCWEQSAYAAPPEWTVLAGSTTSIATTSNINYTKALNGAGAFGWTLNRVFIPNSGRTARLRAVLASVGTAPTNSIGLWLYLNANNYIHFGFYNGGLLLQNISAASATNTTFSTFTINTPYILDLIVTSSSIIGNIYDVTGILIATATHTTNIPASSLLIPRIGSIGLDANGILVSESQYTPDATR